MKHLLYPHVSSNTKNTTPLLYIICTARALVLCNVSCTSKLDKAMHSHSYIWPGFLNKYLLATGVYVLVLFKSSFISDINALHMYFTFYLCSVQN